jgi:hypothetical protein
VGARVGPKTFVMKSREVSEGPIENRFILMPHWLGLRLGDPGPIVRAQFGLAADEGLAVLDVLNRAGACTSAL